MARKIISCSACNARFDVAKYPPGSRVRCGRCQQVLTVPGEPEADQAPRRSTRQQRAAEAFARGGRTRPPVESGPGQGSPARGPAMAPARPAQDIRHAAQPAIRRREEPPVSTSVSGAPLPERDPLLGALINGVYRIVRKLGEGGYGAVYEAKDVNLERRVAVKVMLPNRAQSREYVAKFLREARTAAQLSHPNVVAVHGVGFDRDHGVHFLAMEFVEGRTVHDILQERGPLPIDECVDYIVQSCRGLAAAHVRNIIHRDIKPGNLMVTPGGAVKIADFGLAKVYDADAAQSTVIGTPYFMPPEQFEGKARDGRTDIYALGVTWYYMLTMQRPHTGSGPAQILLSVMTKEPTPVHDHRADLPESLWPIVRKMIDRDPETRYSDCAQILRDLESWRGGVAEEVEHLYCPECGVPNDPDAATCSGCAASLLETCPVCGAQDAAGTKFCGECGCNIAMERAVVVLVDEAREFLEAGRLGRAREKLVQARERAPEKMSIVEMLNELDGKRRSLDTHVAAVRELLAEGRPTEARQRLELARGDFPESVEVKDLDAEVASAAAIAGTGESAAHDDVAEAERLEEEGRLREALVAWRGVLVLSPDDRRAREGERRLAERVEQADALAAGAAEMLSAGNPEAAFAQYEQASLLLPDDRIVETRLEEARRLAHDLRSELEALSSELAAAATEHVVQRLRALATRFPGAEEVADVLAQAEDEQRREGRRANRAEVEKLLGQGANHETSGRWRDALNAYRKAASLDADDAQVADGLARSQRRLAEFDAVLNQARHLLDAGDPEGARDKAQSALEILQGDPAAQAQLARARTTLETMTLEGERIRAALKDEPGEEELNWAQDLVNRYPASKLTAEILREAEEACRLAEERAAEEKVKPAIERAAKLENDGNLENALDSYRSALETFPEHEGAKIAIARIEARIAESKARSEEAEAALSAGDPESALAAAEASLQLLPDRRGPAGVKSAAQTAIDEIDRAEKGFLRKAAPDRAAAQIERLGKLAEKYPGSGRAASLLARAKDVLVTAEDSAREETRRASLAAAREHLAAGELAAAEAACKKVTGLVLGDPEASALLEEVASARATAADSMEQGLAAAAQGAHAEAIEHFEQALSIDGSLTPALEGRAASQSAIDNAAARVSDALTAAREAARSANLRGAAAAWQAVLDVAPDHAEALRETGRLQERIRKADDALESGRNALDAGDPDAALGALREARTVLGPDETADALLSRASQEAIELERELRDIEAALSRDGDLSQPAAQAASLASRFSGSERARQIAERAGRVAADRRKSLSIVRVRALLREGRLQEALDQAEALRAEGVDSPELAAAHKEAQRALGELTSLREEIASARAEGRLGDAQSCLQRLLEAVPQEASAREDLTAVEETIREIAARTDMADNARRRGALADAVALLQEAVVLNPGSQELAGQISNLEAAIKNRREMMQICEAALARGDGATCAETAARLIELYPDDDDAHDLHTTGDALRATVDSLLSRAERQFARIEECTTDAERKSARDLAARTIEALLRVAPEHPRGLELRDA